MLVYDVTNEKSFDNIRNWIRNIEEVYILCAYIICMYSRRSNTSAHVHVQGMTLSNILVTYWPVELTVLIHNTCI